MVLYRPQHPVDYLVVGLGNPGSAYEGTRHNVGFAVLETLVRRHGFARFKRGFDGRCSEGRSAVDPFFCSSPPRS